MVQGLTSNRLLDHVVGHQTVISQFLSAFDKGQLPHSFVFSGPSGIGKKTTARALAQVLLCEKSPTGCGICGSCLRVLKPPTEALLVIEPEKHLIKLEQAHQILEFLQLRSLGRHRVVIIDGAESLNAQAGNSLLKVIEEPPPGTFFFLIAPSPAQILRTLRSRSQIVSFSPLTVTEMKKKSSAAEWMLRASQGSFERLAQLSQKEELEIRESAVRWLRDWMKAPKAYLKSEYRDLTRSRVSAHSLSQHLCWLLRDAAYLKVGSPGQILNVDQQTLLSELSSSLSADQLLATCEKALKIQGQLDANFDSSLVFEQFWIETRGDGVLP